MRRAIVAIALLAACRGGHHPAAHRDDAGAAGHFLVPKLPMSEDPASALGRVDGEVALYRKRGDTQDLIGALLESTKVHGRLEDFQEALAVSAGFLEHATGNAIADAWRARTRVLTAVHRFADARAALEHVKASALNDTEWRDLAAAIDEASGHLERSAPIRERIAHEWGSPANLTALAGSLAAQGKLDEALAVMPKAAANVRDNSPALLAYILFQWGRIYELRGEPAAARELYSSARTRLPTLEETTHLAQAMIATGDSAGAKKLVDGELAAGRHPELVALAAQLEPDAAAREKLVAEARSEWERYVAALPEAFSDHAARFYLGVGANPARAAELAKQNLANRDTLEARALAVEALVAAHDPAGACELVAPLADARAIRAQRFIAWRALAACGRTADAERLAGELGIAR
jgi:tetratricopeptide (TPR) repeat protein